MSTPAEQRKWDLGRIHAGKKALGWSDDDYRYHLSQLTGQRSAAELTPAQRNKVLAHMATLGYQPKKAFKPFGQTEKIEWLWRKLHEAGGVQNGSSQALLAFVHRTTHTDVASLRWLPTLEASTVIEALKAMLDRAKHQQINTQGEQ